MTRTSPSRAARRRGEPARASPFARRCARLGPALMRDLGLTDVQAAGLLGNLGHETGGFRHMQEAAPAVVGSRGGWGIAQWTGPRRAAMEAWCRAKGLDSASDDANEGYLCHELATAEARALAALKGAATLEQATEVVCRLFERPGVAALPDRMVWARRALAAIRRPETGQSASSLPTPARRVR
jgi:hypothetical protein